MMMEYQASLLNVPPLVQGHEGPAVDEALDKRGIRAIICIAVKVNRRPTSIKGVNKRVPQGTSSGLVHVQESDERPIEGSRRSTPKQYKILIA
jgi:hypothetical protein